MSSRTMARTLALLVTGSALAAALAADARALEIDCSSQSGLAGEVGTPLLITLCTVSNVGGVATDTIGPSGGTPPPGTSLRRASATVAVSPTDPEVLSGTPTSPGTFTFSVAGTVQGVKTTEASYSIVIYPALVASPAALTLTPGKAGSPYAQMIAPLQGGAPSRTVSRIRGGLPPGLTLRGDGSLSGVPAAAGTYTFVLQTTDSIGGNAQQSYSLAVSPGAPAITSFTPTHVKPPAGTYAAPAHVTITGKNLTGTTTVRIGSLRASFKVVSATKIIVTLPAHAVTSKITVVTPGGTATSRTALAVS
jgi:large repetitive protein